MVIAREIKKKTTKNWDTSRIYAEIRIINYYKEIEHEPREREREKPPLEKTLLDILVEKLRERQELKPGKLEVEDEDDDEHLSERLLSLELRVKQEDKQCTALAISISPLLSETKVGWDFLV